MERDFLKAPVTSSGRVTGPQSLGADEALGAALAVAVAALGVAVLGAEVLPAPLLPAPLLAAPLLAVDFALVADSAEREPAVSWLAHASTEAHPRNQSVAQMERMAQDARTPARREPAAPTCAA